MPTYRVTAPDGRVFKLTGDSPPTEGELIRIYGSMGKPKQPTDGDTGTPFMRGLGGSLVMTGKGLQQKVAQLRDAMGPSGATVPEELLMKIITGGKPTEQITQEGEEIRPDLERLKDEQPGAKVGAFFGDALPGLAVPGGIQGKLITRALTGAAAGALQGLTRFTGKDESTLGNVATGAAIGGALPVALTPVAKVVNAIRGNLVKPINLGAEQGIPTTLGEDVGSPFLQKMETLMERIPIIGTTAFRKQQYEAAEGAAKDYLGKYVADDLSSVRGVLDFNRRYVDTLYNKVRNSIKGYEDLPLYARETNQVTSELLSSFPDFFKKFQNQKVEGMLNSIKGEVSYAGKKVAESVGPKAAKGIPIKTAEQIDPFDELSRVIERQVKQGKPPVTASPILPKGQLSFDDMWELRKGIGDMIGQAKQKLISGDVSKEQYAQLSKLYSAINQDMDVFANSVGNKSISEGLKSANEGYKQFVVKYNVMDRAMDKAMGQEGTGRMFSPQRFSSELNKILTKEKYNNLFTAAEKREMAGMANIMTTVKRAGQFMENPPTGNRMIDLALGGGAVAAVTNPAAATTLGTSAVTTGLARFLTTTQAGKRFAVAASSMEPDSPAMKVLVEKVMQGARSLGVNQATGGQ